MKRTLLALVLILAAAGTWLIAGADRGLQRDHVVASGVPLDVVHPSPGGGRRPGVVVAHGYAGSARLMAPFGDSLAARGYVVVLLDFAGHGANTDVSRSLEQDLDVAVAHLRSLPGVDPGRVALAGHSMGAGAVTRYAAAHPEIAATVAISLPGATAGPPARLLALVGALEFAGFRTAATEVAAAGGDRAARTVPGVEHITILYAPEAHRATVAWLDDAFGGPQNDAPIPFPGRRLAGTVLLILAFLAGFPLLLGVLRAGDAAPRIGAAGAGGVPRSRLVGRERFIGSARVAGVTAVATGIGAAAAGFLPTERVPQAIAGFVAAYAVISGALLLAYGWKNAPPQTVNQPWLLLTVPGAVVAIAVPVHLGMTHAWPVGPRWWLLPIVWAAFALLALATDRLTGGDPVGTLTVAAVFVVVLIAAAAVGLTSGFVLLVVVPLIALLLWQAWWAALLHRVAAPAWVIALTGSAVVAWPLAVTLPLTG